MYNNKFMNNVYILVLHHHNYVFHFGEAVLYKVYHNHDSDATTKGFAFDFITQH